MFWEVLRLSVLDEGLTMVLDVTYLTGIANLEEAGTSIEDYKRMLVFAIETVVMRWLPIVRSAIAVILRGSRYSQSRVRETDCI